jgi:hypothetical protein
MTNLLDRALQNINLKYFNQSNSPEYITNLDINIPNDPFYIRNMLIFDRSQSADLQLPDNLIWVLKFVKECLAYESIIRSPRKLGYLTIRSGPVITRTDDQWHTDGFSTRVICLPQLSYFWSNKYPTQYVEYPFELPEDFDPLKHNLFKYIEKTLSTNQEVKKVSSHSINLFDPYVIHRRQPNISNEIRAFVRYTSSEIYIPDINLTQNHLLLNPRTTNGVAFRNTLLDYHVEKYK